MKFNQFSCGLAAAAWLGTGAAAQGAQWAYIGPAELFEGLSAEDFPMHRCASPLLGPLPIRACRALPRSGHLWCFRPPGIYNWPSRNNNAM